MKKSVQLEINKEVMSALDRYNEELNHDCPVVEVGRLRTCQACVYQTSGFYVLRSYRTVVAVIEKSTDTCYDFLRAVYGHTNASAQHISKFDHDYGRGAYGCKDRVTYREI